MSAIIRKAGTRRGQPHYSLQCRACPADFGRTVVLAIGHLSREGAEQMYAEHLRTDHGRAEQVTEGPRMFSRPDYVPGSAWR